MPLFLSEMLSDITSRFTNKERRILSVTDINWSEIGRRLTIQRISLLVATVGRAWPV